MATMRRVLTAFFVSVFAFQTLGLLNLVRVPMAVAQTATVDPVRSLADAAGAVQATLGAIADATAAGADMSGLLQQLATQSSVLQAGLAALDGRLGNAAATLDGLVQQGAVPLEKATALAAYRSGVQTAAAALLQSLASLQAIVAPDTISAALEALQQLRAAPGDSSSRAVVDPGRLPHRRANIPRRDFQARSPILPGQAPPGPADLASTVDASMTPEIQAQATAISCNPVALFAFVRDGVEFQPYFGSVKGSQGALLDKAGNDMDQASLLIALLRTCNVPARYVAGVVEMPVEKAMNWVGVDTPAAAVEAFARNGFPSQAVTSADGTITRLALFHVWAEAFLPQATGKGAGTRSQWVALDPGFKQYDVTSGIDLATATGFDIDTFLQGVTAGATVDPTQFTVSNLNEEFLTQYAAQLGANLDAFVQVSVGPTATVGDVLGTRTIRTITRQELNVLAQSFPFKTFTPQLELAELPSDFRYQIDFAMFGFSRLFGAPELAGRSVTLTYRAATTGDQAIIDAVGGIFNVFPAFIVNMTPELRVDGAVVSEGAPVPLGSSQILRSIFLRPLDAGFDSNDRDVTTGAAYAIVLDLQRVSPELVQFRIDRLQGLMTGGTLTPELLTEGLHFSGLAYFSETDRHAAVAGDILAVNWTREPSEAIFSQDLTVFTFFGLPLLVAHAGVGIDVKRNVINPVARAGDASAEARFMLATGSIGSASEHGIIETLYGVPSVSTIKIFHAANAAGMRFLSVDRFNQGTTLPRVRTFPNILDFIQQLANQGFTVLVPERNVQFNDWLGIAFLAVDPATGSAGYFIAGFLTTTGAVTGPILNGGASSQPEFVRNLEDLGKFVKAYETVERPALAALTTVGLFFPAAANFAAAYFALAAGGAAAVVAAPIFIAVGVGSLALAAFVAYKSWGGILALGGRGALEDRRRRRVAYA